MQNLYWKSSKGKTLNLVDTPFKTEAELEKYLFDNRALLHDIFILNRQIRTGSRQGIPDMLGVDRHGRICLIELKNDVASEDVLPQVLRYAGWAENNPDSIEKLWLQCEGRPEDIEINWDKLEIRIIIIAPGYRPEGLTGMSQTKCSVELIKVNRFTFEGEEFVLLEKLEGLCPKRPGSTKAMPNYNFAFYEKEHGKEATTAWFGVAAEVERIAERHAWQIQKACRKHFVGFQYANRNLFKVKWSGLHGWVVQVNGVELVVGEFTAQHWDLHRYVPALRKAIFKPRDAKAKVAELESLLKKAYENIRGQE